MREFASEKDKGRPISISIRDVNGKMVERNNDLPLEHRSGTSSMSNSREPTEISEHVPEPVDDEHGFVYPLSRYRSVGKVRWSATS